MSDEKQETIADIAAEMRLKAEHFEKASNLMVSESALALFLYPIIYRIEAAAKREELRWAKANGELARMIDLEKVQVGNAAAMREALGMVLRYLQWLYAQGCTDRCRLSDEIDRVVSALAAPPRNCENYDNKTDAETGFVEETGEDDSSQHYWQMFANWLFAPATEHKGESDGSK